MPEVVPDGTGNLAKYWSEWKDLNLRPPRPEPGVAFHCGVDYPLSIALWQVETHATRATHRRSTSLITYAAAGLDFYDDRPSVEALLIGKGRIKGP